MSKKTSGTWWIIPADALQMFRATFCKDGRAEMAGGSHPSFDPTTALYATSDMVTNLCATHHITINGDVASKRRFMSVVTKHAWKELHDLEQACNHTHLGRSMPKPATIIAVYANEEEISA